MKTEKFLKKTFISAYMDIYHVSKKTAIEVYNESTLDAVLCVIKWCVILHL